jgi:putative phosphoribosyl transferase
MDKLVRITDSPSQGVSLEGHWVLPHPAKGMILFAHGSGSGRLSPRNQKVAETLNAAGFGTLLFDLLTPEETQDRDNIFNIPLLASRLVMATRWLRNQPAGKQLPVGFFGASTGGAAAIWAAAELGEEVQVIVSRGGRPDLAREKLRQVTVPTLLLVGGWDDLVLELHRKFLGELVKGRLEVIPEATHVFEEPGKLEDVAQRAVHWFDLFLKPITTEALLPRNHRSGPIAEL